MWLRKNFDVIVNGLVFRLLWPLLLKTHFRYWDFYENCYINSSHHSELAAKISCRFSDRQQRKTVFYINAKIPGNYTCKCNERRVVDITGIAACVCKTISALLSTVCIFHCCGHCCKNLFPLHGCFSKLVRALLPWL